MVVVLGHAGYHPRFGFSSAGRHHLKCQWGGVPDDVFMVKIVRNEYDGVVNGTVTYSKELNDAL